MTRITKITSPSPVPMTELIKLLLNWKYQWHLPINLCSKSNNSALRPTAATESSSPKTTAIVSISVPTTMSSQINQPTKYVKMTRATQITKVFPVPLTRNIKITTTLAVPVTTNAAKTTT